MPYESGHEKISLTPYANNKDADQPAYPHSLINIFVIRSLDRYYINFKARASLCSWADRLESYLVAILKDRFSQNVAHMFLSVSLCLNSHTSTNKTY